MGTIQTCQVERWVRIVRDLTTDIHNCPYSLPPFREEREGTHSLFFLFPRYCTLIAPYFINPSKFLLGYPKGMLVTVSNKLSNWGTQSLVLLFGYPYESPPIDARSRPPLLTLRAERRGEMNYPISPELRLLFFFLAECASRECGMVIREWAYFE